MGQINLKMTLDNSDFKKKIDESTNAIKNSGKTAEEIGKKVQEAINNYSLGAKELLDVAKQNFKEQSQIVKQVAEDIEVMQAKLKNMPPSTAQQELTKDVIAAKQALKEETAILNEKKEALDKVSKAYKEHSNETNKTGNKLVTLMTQTRNAREELARMEREGLRGTDAYNELQIKLGELTHQMNATQKQARVLADDEKYLTATIEAISGIAGAFSVAQGAVGLFGEENENLQRIMLKVQSLMAITIGLQQVAKVVNKDSYVSTLWLEKGYVKLAASMNISAAAAKGLTLALGGFLVAGIIALMSWLDKLSQKRKEDEEKTKEQTKAQEEFYKTIGDNAAKQITSLTLLQKEWTNLGNSIQEKSNFINKHKKDFEELGVAIKSVSDAENLLVSNTDAFVNSIIKRALVEGYKEELRKIASEIVQIKIQADKENKAKGNIGNIQSTLNPFIQYTTLDDAGIDTYDKQMKRITDIILSTNKEIDDSLKKAGLNPISNDRKEKDKKDISSYGKSIADIWQKIYQDIEQAKASSINNEFARTTELNTLNAKKELDELDKQIEAIKQKRIEQAKSEYINKTGSEKGFVAPIITLTDEEKRTYEERAKQIIDNVYKLNQEAYTQMIGDYQTFEEKRESIRKTYDEKRKTFEREGLTKNIEVLNKIEQEELKAYDSSFARKQDAFLNWIKNITNLTEKQLKQQIEIAKKSLQNEDLDQKTIALLQEKIKELEERLEEKRKELLDIDVDDLGFNEITEKLSKERKGLREELKKGAEADEEIINKYKENIQNLEDGLINKSLRSLSYIKSMVGLMRDFASAIGDSNSALSETLDNLDTIVSRIGEGVSTGGQMGGGIGAFIGGIVGLVAGAGEIIAKGIKEQNQAQKEAAERRKQIEEEIYQISQQYTLELIRQNELLREAQGIFGTDKEKERLGYLQQYNALQEEFIRILNAPYPYPAQDKDDYILDQMRIYGLTIEEAEIAYEKYLKRVKEGTEYIYNMLVDDGGGYVNLLRNYYPDLIDANGKLNIELLKQIANSGLLSKEQQAYFRNLLANIELQEEALSGLNNYLSDLFGRLKDDWMDNFVNQMTRGEDAMYSFRNSVSETIMELMKQSIYSAFFSNIFNNLEEGLKGINSLNPEDRTSQIADLLTGTLNSLEETLPLAEATWRDMQDLFSQRGFNINETRTAHAQGIQSISQESADRIDGMLTSVQGSIIDIKDMQGTIRDSAISINENVIIIRNHTGEMAQKLDRIDYNINQMVTNGINVN